MDEVVFEPLADRLVVRSHCDEAELGGGGNNNDPSKMTSVQLSLCQEEFDMYIVKASSGEADEKSRGMTELEEGIEGDGGADREAVFAAERRRIRFCLKELRALLSFAEIYATSLGVYFGEAGEPIVFTLDSDPGYEADFVFATRSV